MDILGKYQQEHPEAFQNPPSSKPDSSWEPSNEYSFLIRTVMKLSGGRIRDEKRANLILLAVTGITLLISALIIIHIINDGGPTIMEEDLKLTPPSATDQQ